MWLSRAVTPSEPSPARVAAHCLLGPPAASPLRSLGFLGGQGCREAIGAGRAPHEGTAAKRAWVLALPVWCARPRPRRRGFWGWVGGAGPCCGARAARCASPAFASRCLAPLPRVAACSRASLPRRCAAGDDVDAVSFEHSRASPRRASSRRADRPPPARRCDCCILMQPSMCCGNWEARGAWSHLGSGHTDVIDGHMHVTDCC